METGYFGPYGHLCAARSDMRNRSTAIERAFHLARSGLCSSVTDVRKALKSEGYSLEAVVGPALNAQLKGLIVAARPTG